MPNLADVAARLEDSHKVSQGYRGRCPVHGGGKDVLHAWEEGGRVRVHCFGGCENRDLRAALGLPTSIRNGPPQGQHAPVENKSTDDLADELYADLAEKTPLADILNPNLPPENMARLLHHKTPAGYQWIDAEVAERLAALAEPGYRQYRVVVDEFFNKARYARSTVDEIRKSVLAVQRAKEGSIASRAVSVAHYLKNPPPKKAYQHEQILALSGVTVLAGRPKMGKSYLALNLALSIASGGMFASYFEIQAPGDVLYLALEDDASRMWERVQALLGPTDPPERLQFDYVAPTLDDGELVTELEQWLEREDVSKPRLIVIDVLRYIQTVGHGKSGTLYDTEYADMALLNRFAQSHNLQVLLITHLNKNYATAGDVVDTVMNSTAITGGAGGIWILMHQGNEIADAALHITGKDIPTWDCALKRIDLPGHLDWRALGDADVVMKNDFEASVLLALYTWSGHNPTQTELREAINPGMDKSNFYRSLKRMEQNGMLLMNRRGILLTTLGSQHADVLAQAKHDADAPESRGDADTGFDAPWEHEIDDDF